MSTLSNQHPTPLTIPDGGVILIVDDHPANLAVLSDFLDICGFEVLVAQDGTSAISKVQYSLPDLILLDIMMPGIDGFETCIKIKENPETAEIPIIFMSALSEIEDKVKGLELGAVDYITKPFQQQEVLARVKLHLKIRYMSQQLASQNQILETKVAERTAHLNQALTDLQQAQLQLIQSEKMSSLGQLVAGIAHEINNPINFIYGNIDHAQLYTSQLLEIIDLYQANYPEATKEIEEKMEEYELEFMRDDFVKIVSSMKIGAERIREIVLSLRNFSRMDESDTKQADIHEGIDSTLLILRHRLKSKTDPKSVKIIKEYGELPLIECYPGPLNQVFMNLLANAIDSVEEMAEKLNYQKQPTIIIKTETVDQHWVKITISDNGMGIPDAIQARIFNPFYTTKPVGKGTGMGLAICYTIVVDKHHGTMECQSKLGEGAQFIITIPRNCQLLN